MSRIYSGKEERRVEKSSWQVHTTKGGVVEEDVGEVGRD